MANAIVTVIYRKSEYNAIMGRNSTPSSQLPDFENYPTREFYGKRFSEFFSRQETKRKVDRNYWNNLKQNVFAQNSKGVYFSKTQINLGSEAPYALHIFGNERDVMPHGIVDAIISCKSANGASLKDMKSVLENYMLDIAKQTDLTEIFQTQQVDWEPIGFGRGND